MLFAVEVSFLDEIVGSVEVLLMTEVLHSVEVLFLVAQLLSGKVPLSVEVLREDPAAYRHPSRTRPPKMVRHHLRLLWIDRLQTSGQLRSSRGT